MVDEVNAHWRDSARIPRFFGLDARAAFPLILFLLHIRIWTLVLAIIATLVFAIIERYGFSVSVALRRLRCLVVGNRKMSQSWWR